MYPQYSLTTYRSCNPCCYFSSIGTSVSRWCSDGDCSCACDMMPCCMPCFAFLTQTDAMTVEAGGAIPFTGASLLGEGFTLEDGVLTLPVPGTYRVDYQLNIPSGAAVSTTVVVNAGGVDIAGTQRTIFHTAADGATTTSGHAIFEVTEPTTLALITSDALTLTPTATGDTLATMTVMAI